MEGYDLDQYDDYEDEVGEYEEDGDEYEEQEEEEVVPTKEALEYLELRNKLKEIHRKKMKIGAGSAPANSREKKSKMPYDNFGSFFGPSQPVIAQRVIQESRSLLENPHLAERVSKNKTIQNRGGSSTQAVTKPRPNGNGQPRKVDNYARPQAKIQMLKNTRDYSFLLSDDAELPVPPKIPPKTVPTPKPEVRPSERQSNTSGRKVMNGREERKPVPTSSQMRPKSGPQSQRPSSAGPQSQRPSSAGPQSQRPSTAGKLTSTSLDLRKQVGRNEGSGQGQGRPSGHKPLPSKMPLVNKQKVNSTQVARGGSSIPTGHKPLPSKSPPSVHKRPVDHRMEHRRDDNRGSSNGNTIRKPVAISKPQIKQQSTRPPSSSQHKERPQKRPARPFNDDDDDDQKAISMIRNMFGYNPNRYRGMNDDDDSDMEAGFDDIMQEEKRSARIAAKEDEEELKKIEEEERRERMRKAAKKRKLGNR